MDGVKIARKDLEKHEKGNDKDFEKDSPIYRKEKDRFWGTEGIEYVDASLVAYPRVDGEGLMLMRFKNKAGKTYEIYAPTNQVKLDGLNSYTANPIYKVWEIYNFGKFGNRKSWEPDQFRDIDPNSDFFDDYTVDFRYNEKKIYILDSRKKSPNYGNMIPHEINEGLNIIANSLGSKNQTL
jgi:hypothetical protein